MSNNGLSTDNGRSELEVHCKSSRTAGNVVQKNYTKEIELGSLYLHSPVKTEANVWENSRADQ